MRRAYFAAAVLSVAFWWLVVYQATRYEWEFSCNTDAECTYEDEIRVKAGAQLKPGAEGKQQ
jgi:hypothetical protein